jgi:TetR/AcrR family transcriptional regulator, cholesterol catabolism regulator
METKERILEAAHQLYFKFGIKSVTMDDIARHLGMSKKTIYQFYRDKDEIVLELSTYTLKLNVQKFEEITRTAKDPIQEILQTMEHMGIMFKTMNPNLFYDLQKYFPKAWQQFRDFKENKIMSMVQDNFKRGIEAGLYRSDLNSKVLARLRLEEVEMAMNPLIFPPLDFDISQVQITLLDHFLFGIVTLKGHKLINKYRQIDDVE